MSAHRVNRHAFVHDDGPAIHDLTHFDWAEIERACEVVLRTPIRTQPQPRRNR